MSLPLNAPRLAVAIVGLLLASACASPAESSPPVNLRLQVSLTAEELAEFRPALKRIDEQHDRWTVSLEAVPQESEAERVTTQLVADDLPDVVRLQGLNVQRWIRRGAFLELTESIAAGGLELADFYAGPLDQFRWSGALWGLPDTATPEVVFFDRAAFADAGIAPPDETWTYDDMRTAAIAMTVDNAGRHPGQAGFDPSAIERWGWNGGLTYFWQNAFVQALGGNLCANEDCTLMDFTSADNVRAFEWWVSLVRDEYAAPYDPYGGSQTGVPGDPFLTGRAAMGSNGSFAIGQLNGSGSLDYEIAPPLLGADGRRYTPLSTNGYLISANSEHPVEAWELLSALVEPVFLAQTWGAPGHAVPARRSAADSVVDVDQPPGNRAAILTAMEVGEVFRPGTANAFAAYAATIDLFTKMNTGELTVSIALPLIEAAANEALALDRTP